MDFRAVQARPAVRFTLGVAAAVLAIGSTASHVFAQTLFAPDPPVRWTPPRPAAKAPRSARVRSCAAFGAGFVAVPGSDACVKVGGWVTLEGSARAH